MHYIAGLLTFKEPLRDRWLHAAHHTYTMYPDIDPETLLEPPPKFNSLILDMFRVKIVLHTAWQTFHNAVKPDGLTLRFVPPSEHKMIRRSAQLCVAYYLVVVVASIVFQTWWPILFVFAARFVGAWLNAWIMFPQHAALQPNVADWRLRHPNDPDQPDQPLPGVEHELPRGAPHEPHGSLSPPAHSLRGHRT